MCEIKLVCFILGSRSRLSQSRPAGLFTWMTSVNQYVLTWSVTQTSITLPLHVSNKLPMEIVIFFSSFIGETRRPSRGATSGSFPIRVLRRKWPSFPCLPLDRAAVSRCFSRWTPSTSPARCLLKPPSYWLLEAAATTAEKKTLTMMKNGVSQQLKSYLDL